MPENSVNFLINADSALYCLHKVISERILPDEDKEQKRKGPKGGASIAQKRQGNSNNGKKAESHSDIDKKMEGNN